jgi:hypothetical protein
VMDRGLLQDALFFLGIYEGVFGQTDRRYHSRGSKEIVLLDAGTTTCFYSDTRFGAPFGEGSKSSMSAIASSTDPERRLRQKLSFQVTYRDPCSGRFTGIAVHRDRL